MLSDNEFWQHVKGLEGKSVTTLAKRLPRIVDEVNLENVIIKGRTKPISFEDEWGLYVNYHILHRDKYLRFGDNASGYNISYAIISNSVSDEVEEDNGGLNIRRKK